MEDIYRNNILTLLKYNPNFKNMLSVLSEIIETEEYIISDNNELSFIYHEKKYRLISENRKQEAERMTKRLDFNKDNLVILFGIANIECLKLLYTNINEGSRVVIFEPNQYILKYTLQNYDLTDLFSQNQFTLIVGEDEIIDQMIKLHFTMNFSSLVHNIQVISMPNYYLYDGFRKNIIKNISSTVDIYLKSLGNSLPDIFEGFQNNYHNVDAFMKANSINEVTGKYTGYPAFIIASGPSLDKNIHSLSMAQDKALIITCDASYNACKKNGVKPDAIASIERVEATYKFYFKDKEFDDDLVLVAPGLLWPDTLNEFKGKMILMAKSESGQDNWWTSKFDNVKFVNQGFSCAHVAFSVAKRAGCNPIILVGQDLAYTDEKIHSDSTHTEFEGKNVADESNSLWVEDINGGRVRTNQIYNLFREWFEYQISFDSKTEVIDATEGGARIKGTTIMNLKEAINKYCNKKVEKHMNEYLNDIEMDDTLMHQKYIQIIGDCEKQINILKKIQKKAASHYNTLQKMGNPNFDSLSETQLVELVLKMQKGDKIVKYIIEVEKDVSDFYQQIIKQTIIYVKQIGNQLTGVNVKRNLQLQKNLMHMIKDSTKLIINEYLKSKEFIVNKDSELCKEMVGVMNER